MKKIYRLPVLALTCAAFALPVLADQVVVTLEEPGTLEELLTPGQQKSITDLKVIGPMDGSDLKLLRWMTGMDDMWHETQGQLVNVDLSEADMVAGGEPFTCALYTELSPVWVEARDNTMPEYLFSKTKLETIVFPKTITAIRSAMSMTPEVKGTVIVPEGVLYIGEYAFEGCGMEEIILPSTLTYGKNPDNGLTFNYEALGSHVFDGCANLKKITIPECVKALPGSAFAGCVSLESLTIPESIQRIEAECFRNSGIKDIYVASTTVPKAAYNAFYGLDYDTVVVHVPEGCEELYRAAEEWEYFANIVEEPGLGGSAVTEIGTAAKAHDIYTIDGRHLETDIDALGAGLYVIDGKKVLK